MEIIVGTAGHVDHGKTALVRALTGTDADRLPEEKQRGITIDIGFAELQLGDTHFGFVDVPGHERFVKNMLAGASGIDIVLLVVAADEGVMPQTREHFEICRLLGLKEGIVVLTKTDLVDDETFELATLEIAELVAGTFLENAPVIAVSSQTGDGVEELIDTLLACAERVPNREQKHVAFLPIDRSFTVRGFGAVVTGTLASGSIREGGEVELLPGGKLLRVRGIQTHGRSTGITNAGQRTAVNLAGIDHKQVFRGMVLSEPGVLEPCQTIDSGLEMIADAARPLRSRQRVRLHIGTTEVFARVAVINDSGEIAPGERGLVQFRLESPVPAFIGERFIVRTYSPQATVGGGQVLMPNSDRIKRDKMVSRSAFLSDLWRSLSDDIQITRLVVRSFGETGLSIAALRRLTGWTDKTAQAAVDGLVRSDSVVESSGQYIAADTFAQLLAKTVDVLKAFHTRQPLAPGMAREELRERVFRQLPISSFGGALAALETRGKIATENEIVMLAGHRSELSPVEKAVSDRIIARYRAAAVEPPKLDDVLSGIGEVAPAEARKLFQMAVKNGQMIKVTSDLYFAAEAVRDLTAAVKEYADSTADRLIDVARFKEIAGVSRKYAIPLLEYFDREKVTVRSGDKRLVLK